MPENFTNFMMAIRSIFIKKFIFNKIFFCFFIIIILVGCTRRLPTMSEGLNQNIRDARAVSEGNFQPSSKPSIAPVSPEGVKDVTPPVGSIKINNGALTTESQYVTLNLDAEDVESGVVSMAFTNGGQWSPWEPYRSIRERWNILDVRYGGHFCESYPRETVFAMFADKANNLSRQYAAEIQYVGKDYDYDGLSDQDEKKYGTDLKNSDTDGDTILDGEEVFFNSDPLRKLQQFDVSIEQWQEFRHKYYGFRFRYPQNWVQQEQGKNEFLISSQGLNPEQPQDSLRIHFTIQANRASFNAQHLAKKVYPCREPLKEFQVNGVSAVQLWQNNVAWGDLRVTFLTNKGLSLSISSSIVYTSEENRLRLLGVSDAIINSLDLQELTLGDVTPPRGSVKINKGYDLTTRRYVTLDVTASDDQSEKISMVFSNGSKWSAWEPYQKKKYGWDISDVYPYGDNNLVTVHVMFVDAADNVSKQSVDNISYREDSSSKQPLVTSLEDEQRFTLELIAQLEQSGVSYSALSRQKQEMLTNAYIYGGYPIEAIMQEIKFPGHMVSSTIHWLKLRETDEYKEYINR